MNNKRGLICLILFILLVGFIGLGLSISSNSQEQGQLKVTLEHPFYVNNEWVKAGELEVGDILKTNDGRKAVISSIEKVEVEEGVTVYNLEDELYHNYVVDGVDSEEGSIGSGVVVHNSNAPVVCKGCLVRCTDQFGCGGLKLDDIIRP